MVPAQVSLQPLTFTCKLPIMFATALVIADHAHNVLTVFILDHCTLMIVTCGGARHGRGGRGGRAVDLRVHLTWLTCPLVSSSPGLGHHKSHITCLPLVHVSLHTDSLLLTPTIKCHSALTVDIVRCLTPVYIQSALLRGLSQTGSAISLSAALSCPPSPGPDYIGVTMCHSSPCGQ